MNNRMTSNNTNIAGILKIFVEYEPTRAMIHVGIGRAKLRTKLVLNLLVLAQPITASGEKR